MKKKFLSLKNIVFLIFIVVYVIAIVALNMGNKADSSSGSKIFENAVVTKVVKSTVSPDTWTEGRGIGDQQVKIKITSGKYKGEKFELINNVDAYRNVNLKKGSHIIVNLDYNEQNNIYVTYIMSYNRVWQILFLLVVFCGLLILFGGKKGIGALLGLVFTIISIWFFMIPIMQKGFNPVLASIILVIITTSVSLIFLNGISYKTLCAVIGCISGVVAAGIVGLIACLISPVNGFNMAEAESLVLVAKDDGLKISGILIAGILISSLGAIMDVSMTITSSLFEVHNANGNLGFKELVKSGMNIGKDAMGTMANTLILAFAGASLNTLILFRVYDYPYKQLFNSDTMILEIIKGFTGSIGIFLTVPVVSIISGFILSKNLADNNSAKK